MEETTHKISVLSGDSYIFRSNKYKVTYNFAMHGINGILIEQLTKEVTDRRDGMVSNRNFIPLSTVVCIEERITNDDLKEPFKEIDQIYQS